MFIQLSRRGFYGFELSLQNPFSETSSIFHPLRMKHRLPTLYIQSRPVIPRLISWDPIISWFLPFLRTTQLLSRHLFVWESNKQSVLLSNSPATIFVCISEKREMIHPLESLLDLVMNTRAAGYAEYVQDH